MMMVKMSILKVMMGSCSSMSSSPYGAQWSPYGCHCKV
jgi:hypothetical protein